MPLTEKDLEAGVDGISATHSNGSVTQNESLSLPDPLAGQGDLEKVMSRHEDKDVAVEVLPGTDPNVVGWDGPGDLENPLNWPARQKWINIGLLSLITTLTSVLLSNFINTIAMLTVLAVLSLPPCLLPVYHKSWSNSMRLALIWLLSLYPFTSWAMLLVP